MYSQQKTTDKPEALGACAEWCSSEFRSDNIGLDHDRPQDFVTSQWAVRPHVYVIYRLLAAAVLLGWMSGDVIYESEAFYGGEAWRWLFFASNWSFALVTLTAVLQAVTSSLYAVQPHWVLDPVYQRSMPGLLKFQWILFNVSSVSALVVTVAYWCFIAYVSNAHAQGQTVIWTWEKQGVIYNGTESLLTSPMSRLKHTANSVYVIADVMLGATPLRLYHWFFTVFVGSVYTVFNAMYYLNHGSLMIRTGVALDGRDYYFMNWAQPVEAIITVVFGIMLSAGAQFLLHGLTLLRRLLRVKFGGREIQDSELQNIVTPAHSYSSIHEP